MSPYFLFVVTLYPKLPSLFIKSSIKLWISRKRLVYLDFNFHMFARIKKKKNLGGWVGVSPLTWEQYRVAPLVTSQKWCVGAHTFRNAEPADEIKEDDVFFFLLSEWNCWCSELGSVRWTWRDIFFPNVNFARLLLSASRLQKSPTWPFL